MIKLRRFTLKDADRMVELGNNPHISKNLRDGFPSPMTYKDARKFLKARVKEEMATVFAIEYDGEYVGNVGVHPQEDVYRRSAEIGYFIGEPYWGKGIATEAIRQAVEYGFTKMGMIRIYAGVYEYNIPSMVVLEKNGFGKEGIFRKAIIKNGRVMDEHRYAIINPAYE